MKEWILHVFFMLAAGTLIYLSELWYDGDKVLGIASLVLFGLYLQGWKRRGASGIGLVIITVFYLFTLDSIFFVQDIPIFVCSLVMGIFLIPHFPKHRDAVSASIVFVLLNMLISIEFMPSEVMMWAIAFVTGAAAVFGFRYGHTIVKVCFAVLFALSALFLLLVQLTEGKTVLSILAVSAVIFFIIAMIRGNSKVAV